ncbi:MAG: type II toxin-antitoxin system VapC family toxin [Chloroflexota bacterium]
MTWLLDTHCLIWTLTGDERLSPRARSVVADPANRILVSAATAWEVALKVAIGRLTIPVAPERLLDIVTGPMRMETVPIEFVHALAAASLPPIHRDPFDRLLVAQAQALGVPILTADTRVAAYGVATAW